MHRSKAAILIPKESVDREVAFALQYMRPPRQDERSVRARAEDDLPLQAWVEFCFLQSACVVVGWEFALREFW